MDSIGSKICKLSYKIKREIKNLPAIVKLDRISATNGIILIYIYDFDGDVFQKDIENHFGMTRSTASRVISLMEDKNLIIRESVSYDQRLKRLVLTDEAKALCVEVKEQMNEFENKLVKDLDIDLFNKNLDLIFSNIEGGILK
jgi:DNA-binding MarR family transcriptional regulator